MFAIVWIGIIPTARFSVILIADCHAQFCAEILTYRAPSTGDLYEEFTVVHAELLAGFAKEFCISAHPEPAG